MRAVAATGSRSAGSSSTGSGVTGGAAGARTDAPGASPAAPAADPGAVHASTGGSSHARPGRVWLHAALLAVVLGVLAAWSAAGGQAVTDEGSVLAQADLLARGEWSRPAAFPPADPDGRFPAMETANVADGREFPYVKHVVYPAVLAAVSRALGGSAAPVFSAGGVWLAAVGAALLTRRGVARPARPDPAVVALWGTALLTPLVFDAGVAMAVGPAAGLVAVAALWLVVAADPGVPAGRRRAAAFAAPAAAAAAVLLRSEALLAVGALGVVASWVAFRARSGPSGPSGSSGQSGRAAGSADAPTDGRAVGWVGTMAGVAVAGVGAVAYVVDGRLTARVLGEAGLAVFTTSGRGVDPVVARASAVWSSVLRPGFDDRGARPVLLVVAAATVVAAALLARRDGSARAVATLAVLAALATSVAVWWSPGLVTGLVPAAPVLVGGLVLVRRRDLRRPAVGVPLVAAGSAAVAILALSYPDGGGAEWGGRYLHVLVPLVVPASILGWSRLRSGRCTTSTAAAAHTTTTATRTTLVALGVAAAVLSVGALGTLAGLRERAGSFVGATGPVLRGEPVDPPERRPLVVTDRTGLGRFAWRDLDDLRLVTVPAGSRADLREVVERLDTAGQDRWSLVQAAGVPLPWGSDAPWVVTRRQRLGTWELVSVARR